MKAIILALIILLSSIVAYAHEEIRTPEEIVNQIMAQQGVASIKQIDCGKVSNEDFELLGDAVMERMAGDHGLHEQMDAMMGGEGSASLQQMHIAMGKNWIGCNKGMAGMMNMNTMPMMMRMMGNYYPAYYNGFDAILLLTVVGWVLFGVSIAYLLSTRQKRHRK